MQTFNKELVMTYNLRELDEWLSGHLGDDVLPFENNAETIECLESLMRRNKQQDACVQIYMEDLNQKSLEYAMQGVDPSSLSQSGSTSLKTLVEISLLLRTKDASDTCLLLGLSEFNQKRFELEESLRTEKSLAANMKQKSVAAKKKAENLDMAVRSIDAKSMTDAVETSKKKKQAKFLALKSKEYKSQIQELTKDLSLSEADPSIYHSALLDRAQDLKNVKSKLIPLRAKLDAYHKLPPDVDLTRVEVEELKRQLMTLEAELSKHIDLLHA